MSTPRPPLTGIVLAAGASRRMGRPKQLLPLAGRPLLQHVLDAAGASAVLTDLVLVLGHAADEIRAAVTMPAHARIVLNPRHAEGQSTSLACGLAAAADDAAAAVVLLGDQPHVTPELIDAMARVFLTGAAPAVRPAWRTSDGVQPGHPVVLGRALWPAVSALGGDRGARAFFAAHPERVHTVEVVGSPPPDVDDDDSYRRVLHAAAATIQTGD